MKVLCELKLKAWFSTDLPNYENRSEEDIKIQVDRLAESINTSPIDFKLTHFGQKGMSFLDCDNVKAKLLGLYPDDISIEEMDNLRK